ncbi:hypothetical protein SAMN05444483_105158 [Salegentibacter echinorum]|uniref:Helix-turn-helix domain-containing protein n=1 Tax=Salegentibacter echinorum TaxID=1073325 RepID=A0A1M5HIB4_SALEC|nr:hypothetical protein [Salegentibacter echinorum]SHG15552.1 hypothetical protein SAMN05444483_105158 [Salegentibacter echinorum]
MEKINYIRHLNGIFEQFSKDQRITVVHRSLYLAIFEIWNRKFFQEVFMINRQQVMGLAKIRSRTTYHKHLNELHNFGYLIYFPSHDILKGSKIRMYYFGKELDQEMN